MNDFEIDLNAIREHLDIIEAKLKEERLKNAYNGGENNEYRNAGRNGNYDG